MQGAHTGRSGEARPAWSCSLTDISLSKRSKLSKFSNRWSPRMQEGIENGASTCHFVFRSLPTRSVPERPIFYTYRDTLYCRVLSFFFFLKKGVGISRRYLEIPATSCPVGRLFSVAGQVDTARRATLSLDTLTPPVFMYEALPLVRKIRTDRIVDEERRCCCPLVPYYEIWSWNIYSYTSMYMSLNLRFF